MPNINDNIPNRTLMQVPGSDITWRHMEVDSQNDLYNRGNVRYFAIKLDDDFANELEQEGWKIVWRNVNKNDEDAPEVMQAYLKVFIKYGIPRYPVNIFLLNANTRTKTILDETDLDSLHIDSKSIEYVDLMIRPYHWTYGNDEGIKAQVQEMNILLAQNGLDDGYEIVYKQEG